MRPGSGEALLKGNTSGDCKMLASAFALVMSEVCGLPTKVDGLASCFLAPGGATIDPQMVGNCENGKFWIFSNHYWAVTGGKMYDVLFARELDKTGWVEQKGDDDFDPVSKIAKGIYGPHTVWGPYPSASSVKDKFSIGPEPIGVKPVEAKPTAPAETQEERERRQEISMIKAWLEEAKGLAEKDRQSIAEVYQKKHGDNTDELEQCLKKFTKAEEWTQWAKKETN